MGIMGSDNLMDVYIAFSAIYIMRFLTLTAIGQERHAVKGLGVHSSPGIILIHVAHPLYPVS